MQLKFLWIQDAVRAGRIRIYKEVGDANFADLMTEHLQRPKMEELLAQGGFVFREGRAPGAPILADGAAQQRIAAMFGCSALGLGSA